MIVADRNRQVCLGFRVVAAEAKALEPPRIRRLDHPQIHHHPRLGKDGHQLIIVLLRTRVYISNEHGLPRLQLSHARPDLSLSLHPNVIPTKVGTSSGSAHFRSFTRRHRSSSSSRVVIAVAAAAAVAAPTTPTTSEGIAV